MFEWESDQASPTYYLYIDARLAETTTRTWKQLDVARGEVIQFDVFDESVSQPDPAYPSRALIAWDAVTDAVSYRIDQYVDSTWSELVLLRDTGATYYRYLTAVLDDDTSYLFRVVPIAENNIEGIAREVSLFMIRRPNPPDVTYAYNATSATITIDEA